MWAAVDAAVDIIVVNAIAVDPPVSVDVYVDEALAAAREEGILVILPAAHEDDEAWPQRLGLIVGAASGDEPVNGNSAGEVDLYAPGYELVSTWSQGRYARRSGPDMASTVVAGLAALLITDGASPLEAGELLLRTTSLGADGTRHVDLSAAREAALGVVPDEG